MELLRLPVLAFAIVMHLCSIMPFCRLRKSQCHTLQQVLLLGLCS